MSALLASDPFAETSDEDTTQSVSSGLSLNDYLAAQKDIFGFDELHIANASGNLIASSEGKTGNFLDPDGMTYDNAQRGLYFSQITDTTGCYAAIPLQANAGAQIILAKVRMSDIFKTLVDRKGLGETGEVLLAQHNPIVKKIDFVSPLRSEVTISAYNENDNVVNNINKLILGQPPVLQGKDYRAEKTLEVARKINHANMYLLAKVDVAEANGETGELVTTQFYTGLSVVAIATLLSMIFARSFTRPLYGLKVPKTTAATNSVRWDKKLMSS
jgi:hypothetical protein